MTSERIALQERTVSLGKGTVYVVLNTKYFPPTMPLHPPAGSALTSPVYFGLHLNASRVCTPELLRAHLQTVRQTLQCDFIVIPTASDSSLAASKASAALKLKNAVRKSPDAVRSTPFTDAGGGHATDTSAPVTDTSLGPLPVPNSSYADANKDDCAFPATATAATAESVVLVESPSFATGRATIPVQHLADAAVDFPSFCRNFLSPPPKSEKSAPLDGINHPESEEPPILRTGKPSFNALDGGLAALPSTYVFAPSTESDLALDSQTWNSAVVCEISPWISPDLGVRPVGRKVSTTVSSRAFRLRDAASNGSSVSAAAPASSCAAGSCPPANPSALFPHSLEGSHSAVAAPHADHASTAPVAAEEKVSDGSARRAPTAPAAVRPQTALIQSKEETEGSEQTAQYNKRSRTAALGPLARKEAVEGESTQVARQGGDEQGRPCAQQLQHAEGPRLTESAAGDTISEDVELKKRSSECSAAPSAAPPAAAAALLSSTRASPLSCDAAATTSEEASTSSASALAGGRRGRQLATERDEQVQLERGLLRHWSFHESAWQREMQWATHVGAFAVITPPPAPDLIPVEYSRLLRAALNQLQPPNIWMKLPLMYPVSSSRGSSTRETFLSSRSHDRSCTSCQSSSQSSSTSSQSGSSSSEGTEGEDARGKDSSGGQSAGGTRGHCCFTKASRRRRRHQARRQQDPWQLWRYIRSMVGPHPSLGLCLEITPDLPDSDSELERWFAEPLRAVVLSPSLFTSSSTCCSGGSFRSISKNSDLRGTSNYSQRSRGNGGTGSRLVAAGKAAGRKNVAAGESGVCLSPRHRRFLMKCAQHRVKIIFQTEENEEDKHELETQQQPVPSSGTTAARGGAAAAMQGRAAALDMADAAVEEGRKALEKSQMSTRNSEMAATCENVQQQGQVGIFSADDFPLLSGAGCATSTERSSQSPPAAAAGAALKNRANTGCHGRGAAAQKGGELVKSSAVPLEEMQPYISYVAQQLLQLPTLKQTELFSAPYRDVLQSPMQPLADNLSAGNYEVFEKDPVKYLRYKEATLLRLREIWPGASIVQQQHQRRKGFEAGQQMKSDAAPYQEQTKQPQGQQQQQHGEERDGRDEVGAVAAAGAPASDTYVRPAGLDAETQKRRKKNRARRRGRHAGRRSAYYWDYGSDEEEEDDDGAAATSFLDASSSSSAAASPASAFTSSAYSGGCPPPPPPASSPCLSSSNGSSVHASDWCLRGADCTLHAAAGPRLVLTIVGAGRGPLVQAALEALREAGIPLCRARVFAVEKNWNAVITLRSRVRSDACVGWRAVEVVEADMREAGDCVAERADILISELLGSFGDNELSAECLDGAQMRLVKKGGVSIPSAYVSSLEPVSTHTLWQAIDSYNDPKQFECAYVVNMFAKYFPSKEGPKECFHYRHPHFLLPFGDDGEGSSSSSRGRGDRSRWGSESTSSDSESDIERTDDGSTRKKRSSRTEKSSNSSSESGRIIRRREDEAGRQDGRKEGYPHGTDIQGETYKRHEVYAVATNPETLHVEGTAGSDAEGSGTATADGRSPEQQDAGVHSSPVACTATQGCAENKESGAAGEKRGSGTSTKASAISGQTAYARKKNKKKPSYKERCGFTAAELTILRHRRTRLSWRMRTDAVVHGLAGYFHCCLYKSVYISIDPRSFSEGMFSWFPLFLPFRQPVYVRRNEKLEVYIARDGDEHKVWYEWAVLQPTLSEIYNHMGKHSYIGK